MTYVYKDFVGNNLCVEDEVLFTSPGKYKQIRRGTIISISPSVVVIQYECISRDNSHNQLEKTLSETKQLLKNVAKIVIEK